MNEHVAKAHQEVATRNSQTAVAVARQTEASTKERLDRMEATVALLVNQVADMQRKYNLLLSKNFNGGSTSE